MSLNNEDERRYLLSSYQFDLPHELIAQRPMEPRDRSRLMVVERSSGRIYELVFRELADLLEKSDQIILNDTKVFPARLVGMLASGGQVEIFLLKRHADNSWEALTKPAKKLKLGVKVQIEAGFSCEVIEILSEGLRRVRFSDEENLGLQLKKYGKIPLPPYIQRKPSHSDEEQYQTVYARQEGAVAAPTAGLHFTHEMLNRLERKGVDQIKITLHVGLGTFRPVQTEDIRQHAMHSEHVMISSEAARKLANSPAKQICVGTTTCRALETAIRQGGIKPGEFDTDIFIYPGFQFRYVKSLLTNFHVPGTSLLMLVCAFGGYDLIMEAYRKAVKEKYRFFSYGDAMLIV